ncbi:MAG: response regulator receiver modulated diguanylate cyclase [Elusimicrobia bacterium]|nr:MAG: response regulator receiver modulated diguanylate cyclase [Elusimicrobiota bacterium]
MAGRLVVVDDTEDLLFLIEEALVRDGYEVRTAGDGAKALELIRQDPPDAVILDLWMPEMDGFEVVRQLKDDPLLQHLPVLIMSAAGTQDNKIHGLDLGADDFVTKPFDMPELVARVRMVLRRTKISLDANPLTHLPGNTTIQSRVEKGLRRGGPLAVLYCDLNDFKAYNDAYGYAAGDHALKETARVILEAVKAAGAAHEDFVGHVGGDDFIVVTVPGRMEALAVDVCARFDAAAPSLYKDEDRTRGRLLSKDRKGNAVEFPLMTIAVGVCHNSLKPLSGYSEVSALGSELKKAAKTKPGSAYFIDRRT